MGGTEIVTFQGFASVGRVFKMFALGGKFLMYSTYSQASQRPAWHQVGLVVYRLAEETRRFTKA